MPWMYILQCADNSYYIGSTIDLQRRVRDHNDGNGAQYTARRRPVELVYATEFADIRQAYAAEKQVQGWSRAKREALIRGEFEALPGLAKKGFDTRRAKRRANEVKPGSRYGSGGGYRLLETSGAQANHR